MASRDEFKQNGKPHEDKTKEQLYKVLVIGDFGVGKTSIIRRYTEDDFSPNYKLTIGVDFSLKTLQWDEETKISLQLWDIAGHERFWHMTRVYYKYAIAAIIVFDVTRQVTFDSVLKWLGDVNQKVVLENGQPVPILLLANKSDADNIQVDISKLDEFCSKHNISGWFSTSAKENTNITESMNFIVERILELSSHKSESPEETDFVDLGTDSTDQAQRDAYEDSDAYATDSSYQQGNGYANVSKMNGLVGLVPDKSKKKPEMKSGSTCSC